MRVANIYIGERKIAKLIEYNQNSYEIKYEDDYEGPPISLNLPVDQKKYSFNRFPPFFEGLLPEGSMLEALLRTKKIDRHDYLSQLVVLGEDLVGNIIVRESDE